MEKELQTIRREWLGMLSHLANNEHDRNQGAQVLVNKITGEQIILYATYELQNYTEEQIDELIIKRLEMFEHFYTDKKIFIKK